MPKIYETSISAIHTQAICETYDDVRKLIYDAAHKYSYRYDVPFNEVMGAATVIFMKAFWHPYKVKPGKRPASFSTRLYNSLNWELKDYMAKEAKHRGHSPIEDDTMGATHVDHNYRVTLESELSADARYVVSLVLDTPANINMLFKWEGVKSRKGVLRGLKTHLEDCGWTRKRVADCITELRTVIAL